MSAHVSLNLLNSLRKPHIISVLFNYLLDIYLFDLVLKCINNCRY